jgi:hypothetical protein
MDENELNYVRQQFRDADRARRLWKAFALSLLAVFAFFVLASGLAVLVRGVFWQRQQVMRAQMQAERAAMAERDARRALEEKEKASRAKEAGDRAAGQPKSGSH